MKKTIGFIGCGNMGTAMIKGLQTHHLFKPENIVVADPSQEKTHTLQTKYGVSVAQNNQAVAQVADYLVLAVKPYLYSEVLKEIKEAIKSDVLIIVIAVGVTFGDVKAILGNKVKVIRTQPSTPAFVGESDSTLCPDDLLTKAEVQEVVDIFKTFGKVEIISEKLMNVVPAIASSAPVYTMLMIEAMADGGVLHGFPRDQAYRLAAQSVYGAAKLVLESGENPAVLKDQICTPGGTTIEAVKVLEEKGFRAALIDAVDACARKSQKMLKKDDQ